MHSTIFWWKVRQKLFPKPIRNILEVHFDVADASSFFDLKVRTALGRNPFSKSESRVIQLNSIIAISNIVPYHFSSSWGGV
jgi:hypothetical protein